MTTAMLILSLLQTIQIERRVEPMQTSYIGVHKGYTLKETLAALGKPQAVHDEPTYLQLVYIGGPCAFQSCSVVLENGIVSKLNGLKNSLD